MKRLNPSKLRLVGRVAILSTTTLPMVAEVLVRKLAQGVITNQEPGTELVVVDHTPAGYWSIMETINLGARCHVYGTEDTRGPTTHPYTRVKRNQPEVGEPDDLARQYHSDHEAAIDHAMFTCDTIVLITAGADDTRILRQARDRHRHNPFKKIIWIDLVEETEMDEWS